MPILSYQGINAEYRELLPDEEILYKDLPQEDQYFRRSEIPFTDDEIVDIANKEHQYTDFQKKWVAKEEWRMDNGVYAMINGALTFIPGSVYGYVNYWTLENGERPEYRNNTRKIFLVKEFLYFKTKVLGLARGKSRRKGATSEGTFWEWWICGRKEEKIGGMISYNSESVSKIFQMLFMRGFKAMLPCFVADFDSSSDNFIRFVKPVEKKKKGVPIKREGLNSYIDYQPTTLNSYDSGRVSYLLVDESGKWEKVDINTYWSKVKPTFLIGTKKVGFGYFPSTVNPKDKGGENFRIFWEAANQNAIHPTTREPYGLNTPSRVVRLFDPATEGYAGCIDKFGESVIDDPAEPIMGNDGEWITEGSRSKILKERAGLEGERLMEHRRDFPLDEFDLFAFTTGVCEFNEDRLIQCIKYLKENPQYLRQCRLYPEKITKKSIYTDKEESWLETKFADDTAGEWWLFELPEKPNHFDHRGKMQPLNDLRFCIGVDTIKSGFSINGSTATICVFKKSHIVNGEEKGLYPVALFMGKPRLVNHLWENVLLACMLYGCMACIELDAGTSYYDYFLEKDATAFLSWTPRVAIDVTKKHPVLKPGIESANPFQLSAQLQVLKKYVDGILIDGYNGNVHRIVFLILLEQLLAYDHSDRTKSDVVISLAMALLLCYGVIDIIKEDTSKPKHVLPTYKIKMPA